MKVEGPVYADRIGGRLTYRDWNSWEAHDRAKYPHPITLAREAAGIAYRLAPSKHTADAYSACMASEMELLSSLVAERAAELEPAQ